MRETTDCGAVEKAEIASSLRCSQGYKVCLQVITSDSKKRAAISMRHYGVFNSPYGTFFDELCLLMIGFDRGQPPTEKQVS